jgi:hypothetical protein
MIFFHKQPFCTGDRCDVKFKILKNYIPFIFIFRGFKYEVQHGLKIHETPGVGF